MNFKKLSLMGLALLIIAACTKPEKIMDDFSIHIAPTFYKYVVEIELSDLSDPENFLQGDVTVELIGEDAAVMYNIDGKKAIKPYFGTLQLITTAANEPTASDPLEFTVVITSNEYRKQTLDIVVNEGDFYMERKVGMLNLNNLPSGINQATTSAAVGSNGELSAPLSFVTDTSNGNPSQMAMTIPTGVSFMTEDGTPISGSSLDVDVINYDDTQIASQNALPNGGGSLQTVDINGTPTPLVFSQGATFDIDMSLGGQEVKKFSGSGVELSIPLPSHMFNYAANRPFQAGDSISLLSHSSGKKEWAHDGNYIVVDVNGKLFIQPNITHLSTFKVLNNISSSGVYDIYYFNKSDKVINATFTVEFDMNGEKRSVNQEVNLQPGGYLPTWPRFYGTITGASVFTNKTLPVDIEIKQFSSTQWDINFKNPAVYVELGFKLFCEASNALLTPPKGVKLYYRKKGETGAAKHLHTFAGDEEAGKLYKITQLLNGVEYEFTCYYAEHKIGPLPETTFLIENRKIYDITLPTAVCEAAGF